MPRTVRNAILTDPQTGTRRVVKAGSEVDEETAAALDPSAFGPQVTVPTALAAPQVVVVDGVPVTALRAYAEGRDITLAPDAQAEEIFAALCDADDALADQLAAAPGQEPGPLQDALPLPDLTDAELAELLAKKFDEVNEHLDAHPEHAEQVLAAEAASDRPRKGITEGPHARPPQQHE